MVARYIPSRGDIVFLQFNPQKGREQSGMRPAIVLSPKQYNEKVGLMIVCPVTSQVKGYPFEVALSRGYKTHGVILADQVKSIDWRDREARFVEHLPREVLSEVLQKLGLLLEDR